MKGLFRYCSLPLQYLHFMVVGVHGMGTDALVIGMAEDPGMDLAEDLGTATVGGDGMAGPGGKITKSKQLPVCQGVLKFY